MLKSKIKYGNKHYGCLYIRSNLFVINLNLRRCCCCFPKFLIPGQYKLISLSIRSYYLFTWCDYKELCPGRFPVVTDLRCCLEKCSHNDDENLCHCHADYDGSGWYVRGSLGRWPRLVQGLHDLERSRRPGQGWTLSSG